MDWVLLQILYSIFEYQKYYLKYSTQYLSTKSMASNTLLKFWVPKVWHQIRYSNIGQALSVMTPWWEIQRWLKHCKGGLRWVCTFVYSSKILKYLLYSAFEYQKYDLKYSTQILSTKSTTSNTLLKIWVLKSMTSNTLLKYWVSTLRNTRV